jgi:hypothetical protein
MSQVTKSKLEREEQAKLRSIDAIRKASSVVKQYSEEQKQKRENPIATYQNVKSKIAGNMKSITKT